MNQSPLTSLLGYFALLSLFAVGGANAAIPEMHRVAVDVMHWMNDRQFADMYAIAQVSPGPNVIIVALIGYHVAGFAGAGVAITAMCGPTCTLAFFVARTWDRFKERALADGDPGRHGAALDRADRGERFRAGARRRS